MIQLPGKISRSGTQIRADNRSDELHGATRKDTKFYVLTHCLKYGKVTFVLCTGIDCYRESHNVT